MGKLLAKNDVPMTTTAELKHPRQELLLFCILFCRSW